MAVIKNYLDSFRAMPRRSKVLLSVTIALAWMALALLVTVGLLAVFGEPPGDSSASWGAADANGLIESFVTTLVIAFVVGIVGGFLSGKFRRRPEEMFVDLLEERVKAERDQMARELEMMRASDARHMEQWKSETVADLFGMVMDQVDRGVISCRKCAEGDAAHFAGGDDH